MNKPVLSLLSLISLIGSSEAQTLPIVFVTQVPPEGITETITSIGNNHLPTVKAAPRGGDLMIRYGDSSVRALTRAAGYGLGTPEQGVGAIAVRDPHIHWSGQRILFSMVQNSGNPAADRWQMYEATGIEQGGTVQITKVPNQPAEFNNVQPCYAPDDRIIYVSDRTLDGTLATYPAVDERSQGRINTGLWALNPQTAELMHMEHSPSGSFDPVVDSYGRVLFTRWDHLQRDEKAANGGGFDYSSEAANATFQTGVFSESFPEPLSAAGVDLGLKFDLFMPWTVNPDGTDLVTLNHVGRHEFSPVALRSRTDSNLSDMIVNPQGVVMPPFPTTGLLRAGSLMQMTEHPTMKGRLFATDAVLNGLSAGRIVTIPAAGVGENPADMVIRLVSGAGILRDPSVATSATGKMLASVAIGPDMGNSSYVSGGGAPAVPTAVDPNTRLDAGNPFLIRLSQFPASVLSTGFSFQTVLAPPGVVTVINYDNGAPKTFTGGLWQLQPVEVRPTPRPTSAVTKMETPELEVFMSTGVSPLALKSWLRSRDLAMMTVRNVTQRDGADHQQPTNLAVEGGVSSVKPDGGPTYMVKALQVVQGEYLRGYAPGGTVEPGRRIKPVATRPVPGVTRTPAGLPEGSTSVAADGSVAALVPAKRATSWQLIDHANAPVVRERYWLSFQAGEIRSCTSCHGVNKTDQLSNPVASNSPAALRSLLESVKDTAPEIGGAAPFQIWSEASLGVPLTAHEDDDADGTANMLEWGMGSNPVNAAEKPVTPLTVTMLDAVNAKYASVSFSHSLSETRAVTMLETSTDMATWRTVTSMSTAVTTVNPAYSLSRVTNAGGKSETITLTSGLSTGLTADRYYRLRVTMN
jgi:hypothetical protein